MAEGERPAHDKTANTTRPARQQRPPRRRPEPDGAPGEAVVQGAQPAPGRPGSGGRRTRRFGRPGVLRPVAVLPARPPGMQAAAGNFADSPAGHRAGPGWLQRRTPILGGIRIGALRLQAGRHRAPRPASVTLHGGTRLGNLRAPGPCCPSPGQTVNNPPPPAGAGVLPQRAAQTQPPPARPAPARRSSGRRPGAPRTGHDRAGTATRRPRRRRGYPARPGTEDEGADVGQGPVEVGVASLGDARETAG
jgi:hypothetical protein